MSNPSKSKGTSWETAIVRFLDACGLPSRRKALSGSKDTADIAVEQLPDIVIEAKNCRGTTLAEWVDEVLAEAVNAGARIGVVWHHRRGKSSPGDGYVTMTGEHFVTLAGELRDLRRKVQALEADIDWERHH